MDKTSGKIKEKTGKAVGNPDLEAEGHGEQAKGHAKSAKGDIKKAAGK